MGGGPATRSTSNDVNLQVVGFAINVSPGPPDPVLLTPATPGVAYHAIFEDIPRGNEVQHAAISVLVADGIDGIATVAAVPANLTRTQSHNLCVRQGCHTCITFEDGCEWIHNQGLCIGCPVQTCPFHQAEVVFPVVKGPNSLKSGGVTWSKGEVLARREHIVRYHSVEELRRAGATNLALAKGMGLEICAADGCGRISIIRGVKELLRRKDPVDWNNRRQDHGKHLVGRQGPSAQGQGPQSTVPGGTQSAILPGYINKAMAVLEALTLDQLQLEAGPTIHKMLPASVAIKEGIATIIKDITGALQDQRHSTPVREGLWKVLFYLPQFLFFVPRGGGAKHKSIRGVGECVRLFLDEKAALLWQTSHNFGTSATQYEVGMDDLRESLSDDEAAQKATRKWEGVATAAAEGDAKRAAQRAHPQSMPVPMHPRDLDAFKNKLFTVPADSARMPMASDWEVGQMVDSLLEEARASGSDVDNAEETTFGADHVEQATNGYRVGSPPDGGGWRPAHIKWLVKTVGLGEDLLPILRMIALGNVTPQAALLVYSTGFFVLQDVNTGKQRAVSPPSSFAKVAHAALARARLSEGTLAQHLIASGQMGLMKGGTEIAAHLNHLGMAYSRPGDVQVLMDMEKMYYRMDKRAVAKELSLRNEWGLLRAMKAAFCSEANTFVCVPKQRNGMKERLSPPPGGIQPGSPISTLLCVVALAGCVNEAKEEVKRVITNSGLAVGAAREEIKAHVDRVSNDLSVRAIADDITITGPPNIAALMARALADQCYERGVGRFGVKKSMIIPLGGETRGARVPAIDPKFLYDISKNLLTPPLREAVENQENNGQPAVLHPDQRVSVILDGDLVSPFIEEVPTQEVVSGLRYAGYPVFLDGALNVGAVIGKPGAQASHISKRAVDATRAIDEMSKCPNSQTGTWLIRLCGNAKFQSTARVCTPDLVRATAAKQLNDTNIKGAQQCFGSVAIGHGAAFEVQRTILEAPVRQGGMGWTNIEAIAAGAFLAAALSSLVYIRNNCSEHHRGSKMAIKLYEEVEQALHEVPSDGLPSACGVSNYAMQLATGIREFLALFRVVNNRDPVMDVDDFDGTLPGLLGIAPKFQLRFSTLCAKARLQSIAPLLVPEQVAMLRSQSSAATAPFLMGLPSGRNLLPNPEFQAIQQRRLLHLNISQCCFQDLCAAHPAKCSQGGEHRIVDDAHLETCHSVKGGDTTRRHRHL